ncbi:hypothetical protein [Jejuia spongiicola]|uniref:Uncharacterized protein n=1 Tax=Jejuia spongiicola TaxID=2942207 RepID=A0ABT0QC61_9FLAO|nr:hypothetical protein [Jejuia spongiicola]MCL6293560.1 hypothetical protein [Jejuia spongiicola]
MRDIILLLSIVFSGVNVAYSQVGIGTTSPTAQLEIEANNTGIPALEINPQTSPTGSAEGQLAVIGDRLYMYNVSRAKWLSIETTTLLFGRSGNQDNVNLRAVANQSNNRSGYLMPFDGTITYITAKSNNNSGAQSKQFSVLVRNGNTTNSTTNFTTSSSEYTSTAVDVDFSAGDYINGTINNDGNGNVNNVSIMICVKWRQ